VIYTPVPLHVLSRPANEDNKRGSIISTEDLPRSIDAQLVQAVVTKERLIKTPKTA